MKKKMNKNSEMPSPFICDNCLKDSKEVLLAKGFQLCGVCVEPNEPNESNELEIIEIAENEEKVN